MILKQKNKQLPSWKEGNDIPERGYLESINKDMSKYEGGQVSIIDIIKKITSNIDDSVGRLCSEWEQNSPMENR